MRKASEAFGAVGGWLTSGRQSFIRVGSLEVEDPIPTQPSVSRAIAPTPVNQERAALVASIRQASAADSAVRALGEGKGGAARAESIESLPSGGMIGHWTRGSVQLAEDGDGQEAVRQRMSLHMDSMLSSAVVEPVSFPPTEEGYVSQIHWYSFQFAIDELVDELEEAFLAVSIVLDKLPYPII